MLVTEEEALKLWCPATRDVSGSNNQSVCRGSRCMWWRWVPRFSEGVTAEERPEGDGWTEAVFIANDGTTRRAWRRTKGDNRGYCGMAGNPGA